VPRVWRPGGAPTTGIVEGGLKSSRGAAYVSVAGARGGGSYGRRRPGSARLRPVAGAHAQRTGRAAMRHDRPTNRARWAGVLACATEERQLARLHASRTRGYRARGAWPLSRCGFLVNAVYGAERVRSGRGCARVHCEKPEATVHRRRQERHVTGASGLRAPGGCRRRRCTFSFHLPSFKIV
jgi:hypothetical protein